jgi:hypothetical protein
MTHPSGSSRRLSCTQAVLVAAGALIMFVASAVLIYAMIFVVLAIHYAGGGAND